MYMYDVPIRTDDLFSKLSIEAILQTKGGHCADVLNALNCNLNRRIVSISNRNKLHNNLMINNYTLVQVVHKHRKIQLLVIYPLVDFGYLSQSNPNITRMHAGYNYVHQVYVPQLSP